MEFANFTVPLSFEAHSLAQQMHCQQLNPQRARQVYLNTLAVYAVEFYLRCLGIETDTTKSNSRNPTYLKFMDVGDLWIKDLGKLECRPVLPEELTYQVPPEAWSDRLAYIAVQLTQSLKQATLIGFTDTAAEIPLDQLRSMADFPIFVDQIRHASTAATQTTSKWINLRQWFDELFEAGWQELESLLQPKELTSAFRMGSTAPSFVQGGKVIRLTTQVIQQPVILAMKISSYSEDTTNILVEVYPMSSQLYLPKGLQVQILDDSRTSVMQAILGDSNQNIQFDFKAKSGEQFSVQLSLGEASVIEEFVV
jgi:hypothetical protein